MQGGRITVYGRFLFQHAATRLSAAAAMMMVGMAGCAQPTPPAPEEGVTDVALQGIAFVPKEVTITVGESVRWTNLEPVSIAHTTTSGNPGDADAGAIWDSGTMLPGDSFTHRFDEPGEFVYFCEFHPTVPAMRDAKVIVVSE